MLRRVGSGSGLGLVRVDVGGGLGNPWGSGRREGLMVYYDIGTSPLRFLVSLCTSLNGVEFRPCAQTPGFSTSFRDRVREGPERTRTSVRGTSVILVVLT